MAIHWHNQLNYSEYKTKKESLKLNIPDLDTYSLIKNPSSKQVEEAIKLISTLLANKIRLM